MTVGAGVTFFNVISFVLDFRTTDWVVQWMASYLTRLICISVSPSVTIFVILKTSFPSHTVAERFRTNRPYRTTYLHPWCCQILPSLNQAWAEMSIEWLCVCWNRQYKTQVLYYFLSSVSTQSSSLTWVKPVEAVKDFIFLGSKIIADADCSH